MTPRKLGAKMINPVGLGCMGFSHGYYERPPEAESERALIHAIETGYDFLDTAAMYGAGHNEELVGRVLKGRRDKVLLATKAGLVHTPDGPRITGRPEMMAPLLDESLKRLGIDYIDLFYLHRPDFDTPIEDSIGALVRLIEAGKIGGIGLSEVSAEWLRRAASVHQIDALQSEYSLWTRNPEIATLAACRELGTTFVAFSPVGRGFLGGSGTDVSLLPKSDMRVKMPRFNEPNLSHNLKLLERLKAIGAELGATSAQLALAWLLHVDPTLVMIPGTVKIAHLDENRAANDLVLSDADAARLDALINRHTVAGPRYGPAMQATVSTEMFDKE